MTTILTKPGSTRAKNPATTTQSTPAGLAAVVIADPGALGLGAFALTTFVLSLSNTGLIPGAGAAVVGLALFYGGIAQVFAGMWEFVKGNTFGATAFTSYGAFWLAFWWLLTNPETEAAAGGAGVGAFLVAWTIFTAFMTVAALKTNRVLVTLFVALTLTFIFLAIGAFTGITAIHAFGGYLGLATAAIAWYGSAATVINATWKRPALPVWPLA